LKDRKEENVNSKTKMNVESTEMKEESLMMMMMMS
jgi:hypothetical protein